jgi:hypothetical protein
LLFEKAKVKESLTNAEEMLSGMFSKQWRFSTVEEIICYIYIYIIKKKKFVVADMIIRANIGSFNIQQMGI